MNEPIRDATRRFFVGAGSVRGEYVRLEETWRALLERRPYPAAVASLLGECLAASALFTSTLKVLQDDGRLTLQIQGGKPVSLLIAECRSDLTLRAMARIDPSAVIEQRASFAALVTGATFALTIEPGGDFESYQSFVPVEGESLSAALDAYMRRSEQIDTRFVLAADERVAAGLILQKVPSLGGKSPSDVDPDLWNRVDTLAATLTREELLSLDDTEVLHRLFHQEEVRLHPARPVVFACRCSKERVGSVLKVLGREEVQGLLADRRTIEVGCDFCGRHYAFSAREAWDALGS